MLIWCYIILVTKHKEKIIMIEIFTKTVERNKKNFGINIEFEEECKNQYNFVVSVSYELEYRSITEGELFDSIPQMIDMLVKGHIDLYNDMQVIMTNVYKELGIDEKTFGNFQCDITNRFENYKQVNTLYFWSCYISPIESRSFFEQYKDKLKANNYFEVA